MNFLVHSETEIRPTEDPEKVRKAVTNIFRGEVEVRQIDEWSGKIILEGKDQPSLERFRMILQRDRIRAAARSILRRSVEGNRIVFYLNKQAAYAGHVSFSAPEGESPLGPIHVIVETGNPDQLIDWLAGQREERRGD
ncbi:MAG TPA: RNA-binding domain-containing protein [Candidatus Bathyarchaeia archaeon]|nr:RNA-binding domain-containing protein [Candidatus Bathyarchaeia archaeon]